MEHKRINVNGYYSSHIDVGKSGRFLALSIYIERDGKQNCFQIQDTPIPSFYYHLFPILCIVSKTQHLLENNE